jgi:hypothetical protein
MEFNGPIEWLHPSGSFKARPSVKDAAGTLSGLGLRQENFYVDNAYAFTIAPTITFQALSKNTLTTLTYPVPALQNTRLHPKFLMLSYHQHGSAPSDWVCRLYKNGTSVASGRFTWAATINTHVWELLTWETAGSPANIIFNVNTASATADRWSIVVDNDGSGTAINNILVRCHIGFDVLDNDADG